MGSTFRRDLKLISETRAPFRGVRKFIYIAFIAAAGISTFFTVPRVIVALQGGDGAPDLLNTVGNLGINLGGENMRLSPLSSSSYPYVHFSLLPHRTVPSSFPPP